MDRLEKGSGNVVLSEREAQALLKDDEDLVLAVYEYWLSKRLNLVSECGEWVWSLYGIMCVTHGFLSLVSLYQSRDNLW